MKGVEDNIYHYIYSRRCQKVACVHKFGGKYWPKRGDPLRRTSRFEEDVRWAFCNSYFGPSVLFRSRVIVSGRFSWKEVFVFKRSNGIRFFREFCALDLSTVSSAFLYWISQISARGDTRPISRERNEALTTFRRCPMMDDLSVWPSFRLPSTFLCRGITL